ncbi:MAG: aconitate hydratase AcnA [Gammaproteobacteria bacterium]|nr:aconitate hydratase AcnA [Gammaproteobacteria bacterium]
MSNSFNTLSTLEVNGKTYHYHSLAELAKSLQNVHKLPYSLKVLLENQLRHEDGFTVDKRDIKAFPAWLDNRKSQNEIAYRPSRVLMQDFTGVPAVVDLAAMRDAMQHMGGDPEKINPLCPVDLVIDHSVQVDKFGNDNAFHSNVEIEVKRNYERYSFLKWGQETFQDFRVVPPGTGICHQVNLEYLGKGVRSKEIDGKLFAFPDTLVGTDSHTTMINGLGVLGWGVGGIEAEAAILGQPISMLIPEVIGFRFTGKLREGITATDLVLTVVQLLRKKGVVGKFVEFFGPGLSQLPLADRATIANMTPEFGATCGLFPIDAVMLEYLAFSGRDQEDIDLVKAYSQAQGFWHDQNATEACYTDTIELDLGDVVASVAGPKRPQDRVAVEDLRNATETVINENTQGDELDKDFSTTDDFNMHHGDVVIAAITSCTNTSNPSVMVAAGLVAKKAVEKGLQKKPWVKTSLAPGSKVVTDYLVKTDLMPHLEKIGFYLVGYGCTTCIGNSGPLPDAVSETVSKNKLIASAVLSGNRNFEGRIHPQVKASWLASPPLVVAYALAGTTRIDLSKEALGEDPQGKPVYLKDIWPSQIEIAEAVGKINSDMFHKEYGEVFKGDNEWRSIKVDNSETYHWLDDSTYVRNPPYFTDMQAEPPAIKDVTGARILALLGDSITTDHISPAGAIKPDSPAGKYLIDNGVAIKDFNSFGSRRGNHEVMMRGTFANIRIRNEIAPGTEGGVTKYFPDGKEMSIYDAAMQYQQDNVPLVVFAGKDYGMGSSRDWAAKGTLLLGVKAVIAESFERIHRSNLIGMGVLPLEFKDGMTRKSLKLKGDEHVDVLGLDALKPQCDVTAVVTRDDGTKEEIKLLCRIDTQNEFEYYRHEGILQYVIRNLLR